MISEYTENNIDWGFSPHPTGAAHNAPQTLYWFQGGRFPAGHRWRGGDGRTIAEGKEGLEAEGKGGERDRGRGGEWRIGCWG